MESYTVTVEQIDGCKADLTFAILALVLGDMPLSKDYFQRVADGLNAMKANPAESATETHESTESVQ